MRQRHQHSSMTDNDVNNMQQRGVRGKRRNEKKTRRAARRSHLSSSKTWQHSAIMTHARSSGRAASGIGIKTAKTMA